ncbi:MAG: outer membrane beta-barrel protein [Bacteroidota bacterium]
MRKLFTALTLALCVSFAAPQAAAQFSIIPYIGYNTEAGFDEDGDTTGGLLIGIGGEFKAPFELGNLDLSIRPSAEYVFLPDVGDVSQSAFQISGDVIASFVGSSSVVPYAGVGITYVTLNLDINGFGAFADIDDVGLNLLGGAKFVGALGFGDPFVQGRFTLGGFDSLTISGGVAIPLGN